MCVTYRMRDAFAVSYVDARFRLYASSALSSGRSNRTSTKPIGLYRTSRSTIAGYCVAKRAASIPPIECPTTIALSIFKLCRMSRVFRAMSLKLYGMIGFDDRP